MSKKETQEKLPATIKVKTVVISVAVFASIVASFISGWFVHQISAQDFDNHVKTEASALVSQLKIND